jgi:recombination associated protein RdgC
MVKNATFYRYTGESSALEATLRNMVLPAFERCTTQQLKAGGWVAPFVNADSAIQDTQFFCYMSEEKIIPAQAVREELNREIQRIKEVQDRTVRGKEKQSLKDEVIMTMLPKAFTKSKKVYGCINKSTKLVTVFTSSNNQAEEFTVALRDAMGSLPISPVQSVTSPCASLTAWANEDSEYAIDGFTLGEKCKIHSLGEKGKVTCNDIEISEKSIQCHLAAGRMIVELAMSSDDAISFVLTDRLIIKSVKFEDLLDEVENDGTMLWMINQKLTEVLMSLINQMGGLQTDS